MAPPLTEPELDTYIGMPADVGTPTDLEYQRAIVLRGYLEDTDLGSPYAGPNIRRRRLYLTARKDVYVDFEAGDALRIAPYNPATPDSFGQVSTVWLDGRPSKRYFISRPLQAPTGFVSGELLDDFLESQDARASVWPEQQYGGPPLPRSWAFHPC